VQKQRKGGRVTALLLGCHEFVQADASDDFHSGASFQNDGCGQKARHCNTKKKRRQQRRHQPPTRTRVLLAGSTATEVTAAVCPVSVLMCSALVAL